MEEEYMEKDCMEELLWGTQSLGGFSGSIAISLIKLVFLTTPFT